MSPIPVNDLHVIADCVAIEMLVVAGLVGLLSPTADPELLEKALDMVADDD
jgi:hypothetical protein